ncbi:MAG: hypothetical protein AAF092_03305 [Pseudomonadota bacterium]
MASITDIPAGRSLRASFHALGAKFLDGMVAVGRARARYDEIERYMAMSDEELARRGLSRNQIVRHVHRDSIAF